VRQFIALMLYSLLLSLTSPQAPQPGTATIRGIVVSTATDSPIADAELRLTTFRSFNPRDPRQYSTPAISSVHTDREGRFIINDLPAGAYRLTIMRNGYAKQILGQRGPNGIIPPFELSEGEAKDLQIRLTPGGNVGGVVRNTSGRPSAGVRVQLVQCGYSETGDRSFHTIASTQTNDRGEYRFYWISPGRYYVKAGNDDICRFGEGCPSLSKIQNYDWAVENGVNPDQSGRGGGYIAWYYPGVRNTEKALQIDIQPGSEIGAIDFTLEPLRHHIRGRVIDSTTGRPPSWVGVEFYELGSGGIAYYNYTPGTLEISNLGSGTYWVRLSLEDSDSGRPPLAAAAQFVISDSDVEGFEFILTPSPVITGRIQVEGDQQGLPLPDELEVQFHRPTEPETSWGDFGFGPSGSHPISLGVKSGAFALKGSPDGEFRVTMRNLPAGYYLKEARLNGSDVLNAAVRLQAGTMELAVSSKGGQIDGIVSDARSPQVPYVQAVLVPDDRSRPELFKNAITDKAGRFSISAIAPGDYTLFAWEAIDLYAWFDPDFLKAYQTRGQKVRVSEASQQSIEVRMIPAGNMR
jgi:hypothetical protein